MASQRIHATGLDECGVPRKVAELVWRGQHRVPFSGTLAANNGDALLASALQGQGLLYQPDFMVSESTR